MFFCGGAWAGAKGLDVLLINIGDADFFDREVYIEYSNYFENDEQGDCWNSYGDRMSGLYRITKKIAAWYKYGDRKEYLEWEWRCNFCRKINNA